ncbi:MAG: lytic transglycosylase domain-containing protein [Candidatus Aenigmarchaeota archaeon]
MKRQKLGLIVLENVFIFAGAVLIGTISLFVVYSYINPTLANTPKARASLVAHDIALYLGSLSSVDGGTLNKNLNDTYEIQIGKYSIFKKFISGTPFSKTPLSNYYVKVLLYGKRGNLLAESEDVSFISNLDIKCNKSGPCMETGKISFLTFTKKPGENVKLEGFETVKESGLTFCREVSEYEIERYIRLYGIKYAMEKALVLAVMGAENYMEHCDRYGHVSHSTDKYGNPVAFGLMQMTPGTAKLLEDKHGVEINVEDPEQNVMAGIMLLSDHLMKFTDYDDQKELAVAYYNCGGIAKAVNKYCKDQKGCWEKIKPHLGVGEEYCMKSDETIPYVERVMRLYGCFKDCLKTRGDCYSMSNCKDFW